MTERDDGNAVAGGSLHTPLLEAENPFSSPSDLDYGCPAMTAVDDRHWASARRAGIAAHRAEIEAIIARQDPPTVANTLHALGRARGLLTRTQRAFSCVHSAEGTEARQKVQAEAAPELAAHQDWVQLHPDLYSRLRELQHRIDAGEEPADDQQRWMLHQTLLGAELAGAGLAEAQQDELKALNRELAAQETAYQQLQRREAAESSVLVQDETELAGLSAQQRAAAAAAAANAGHEGMWRGVGDIGHDQDTHQGPWLLTLSMPVQQPLLEQLTDRETRRRLHTASVGRGSLTDDDGRTTGDIAGRIAVLRARKARLLGHANYLEAVLPGRMAPDRASIEGMLRQLAHGARVRLDEEVAAAAGELAARGEVTDQLQPWDFTYGIELLRGASATGDVEGEGAAAGSSAGPSTSQAAEVELSAALRCVFDAAHQVYGVTVVEREDLPPFVPGARSFEVFDGEPGPHGEGLGLFLLDLCARDTKSGGAWMNSFSVASSLTGSRPVVINCLNVTPPAAGEPTLLTTSDMKTLFHEFGHALHGLLAEAEFEELSGTAVPRDNVEFPSQVNEIFQELFTGGLGPAGRVPDTETLWGRGASTFEHVAAVVLDLAWHTLGPEDAQSAAEDPQAFEQVALDLWGLDHPLVPPRYSTGFFKHIFAGSGYAAGYYSYLWAEVLAADASEWFREAVHAEMGLPGAGARFRAELLSRGNTRDPYESYRAAIGRDPQTEPMLRSLGMGSVGMGS